MSYLCIGAGGALGSMARYWVSDVVTRSTSETFPWGTLVANVTGCFVIGLIATLSGADGRVLLGPSWREFLFIGFLGGYTTFSSFSLQTLSLAQSGDWLRAGANAIMSLCLCLLGVWLGSGVAQAVNTPRG